jgi:hypothetical protein
MAAKLISADKLRWFFAETLVVVLGILIALGLDDYRSVRIDRALEIDYVRRIQCAVDADLAYIRDSRQPRLRAKRDALDAILPVVRGELPVPEDVVTFLRNVSRGGMLSGSTQSFIADTIFQELSSTGNQRLIRDRDVSVAIISYYSGTQYMIESLQARHTDYVSYVYTAIPAERRDDISLEVLQEFDIDYALKRLLSDEFRNLANQEFNVMLFMQLLNFESRAESLQSDLEAYRLELEGPTDWQCPSQ